MRDQDWEALYQKYLAACEARDPQTRDEALRCARTALQNRKLQNVDWLTSALEDQTRKWFVARAMRSGNQMPERLFVPMMTPAIRAGDPSSPKWFVRPCLRCFGPRRVNEWLLDMLESGSDDDKAGAASALYWGLALIGHDGIAVVDIDDLRERRRCIALRTFVDTENVHLRRCLLIGLPLDESRYPEELRWLVSEAIQIARNHPDTYLRHRVEIQLGARIPYLPLPHRPG